MLFLITFWYKFWLILKFVTNSQIASVMMVDAFVCTTDGNITFLKKLPFSRVTVASFTAFLCVLMQCSLAIAVSRLESVSNTLSVTDLVVTVLVPDTFMPPMKALNHFGKVVGYDTSVATIAWGKLLLFMAELPLYFCSNRC